MIALQEKLHKQGWRQVQDCSEAQKITGESDGICHVPTILGIENVNDSVFSSWSACALHVLELEAAEKALLILAEFWGAPTDGKTWQEIGDAISKKYWENR